jgi:hypothetical protein
MPKREHLLFKLMKSFVTIVLLGYLLIGALLVYMQRSLIYFPSEAINNDYKEIVFKNQEERLKVIVANETNDNAILYFGGNAEAVSASYEDFAHSFKNSALYLVNYRGYGGSSGTPSEEKLYEDALLVYDALTKRHKNIVVIGRSLGSGVATYVAAKRDVKKLILVTPFDSIKAVAQEQFPLYPMEWMLFDTYDSIQRVKEIQAQTLLLIAQDDTLVSTKHSIRLYNAFMPNKVHKELFKGFGHNDIQLAPHYYLVMQKFLATSEDKDIYL